MKNGKRLSSMALAVMMATSLCSGTLTMNVSANDTDMAAVTEVSEAAPASEQIAAIPSADGTDSQLASTEGNSEAAGERNPAPGATAQEQTQTTDPAAPAGSAAPAEPAAPADPAASVTETLASGTNTENTDPAAVQNDNAITPPEAPASAAETEEKADTQKTAIENRVLLARAAALELDETTILYAACRKAEAAIQEYPVDENTTNDEIKSVIRQAIENTDITISFVSVKVTKPATDTEDGIITVSASVKYNGSTMYIQSVDKPIPSTKSKHLEKAAVLIESYLAIDADNQKFTNNTDQIDLEDNINTFISVMPEVDFVISDWVKTESTSEAEGSISATITLSYEGTNVKKTMNINLKIPKDFLKEILSAKEIADGILNKYSAQDFMGDTSQLIEDMVREEVAMAFAAAGSKCSVVEVSMPWSASFRRDITVKFAVKDVEGINTTGMARREFTNFETIKDKIITMFEKAGFSNAATAEDVLKAADSAGVNGLSVSWDTNNGFKLTPATEDRAGKITGTLILKTDDGSLSWTLDPEADHTKIPMIRNLDKEALDKAKRLISSYIGTHTFVMDDQLDGELLRILKGETAFQNVTISWVTPPSKASASGVYPDIDVNAVLLLKHGDVQEEFTLPVRVTYPKEYRILFGSGQISYIGELNDLFYTMKGEPDDYTGYQIDGKTLDSYLYSQSASEEDEREGRFNVTVYAAVLEGLDTGEHTFEALYPGGGVRTKFYILEAEAASSHAFYGGQAVWHIGDDQPLTLYLQGNEEDYTAVGIDDKLIDGVTFSATSSGQIRFSLEPKAFEGLSAGDHTIYAYYIENGEKKSVEKKLVVADTGVTDENKPESKPETKEEKKEEVKKTSPKTGDAANAGMLFAAVLLSGAGAAGAWKKKRFD